MERFVIRKIFGGDKGKIFVKEPIGYEELSKSILVFHTSMLVSSKIKIL